MFIKLHPTPDRFFDRPECPFCHHIDETGSIVWEDYVEYPMLWCDKCGARAVLDPVSYYTWNESTTLCTEPIEIPLLFIERASDSHMSDLICDRMLNDEEMKILSNGWDNSHREYDINVLETLGIKVLDQDEIDELDHNPGSDNVDNVIEQRSKIMNISVPVKSYNVSEPSIPHEVNVDLSHDGVYVYLLVHRLDGEKRVISYWGD